MNHTERKGQLIAAGTTLVVAALIIVWLLFSALRFDEKLASADNPQLEEEELFLDPELLLETHKSVGEPDANLKDSPAPDVKGQPKPAPQEQPQTVNAGRNALPSPEPKLNAVPQESSVQTAESNRREEEEKVATSMAGKFSSKSGSVAGKFDSAGQSAGSGLGVSGKMPGRQFLGCPAPDVTLSHKTTVTVSITVDEDGRVMTATASGATTREILKKCEQAARQAKWSPKKGAASTRGSITFTIIPK